MGLLINGVWQEQEPATTKDGHFERRDSAFRNWITPDGRPGPTGQDGFRAMAGRYHLYVSLACPWAHRTLIMRALKGLQDIIPISVTHWLMAEHGWTFAAGEGVVPDPLYNSRYVYELYARADEEYSGRATVPILWDQHTQTVVNNESSDIIRMFGSAFDQVGAKAGDYYPQPSRAEIDEINQRVYDTLNNGVYKAGFATTQAAYEAAVEPLFGTLDWLEDRLSQSRFLCGETLTEADIRLFTTLVRFDSVYHAHFKCNIRRIVDYRHLWAYTRDIFQLHGVAETVDFGHIKRHYYMSHRRINPTGIVPVGPALDFDAPADRGRGVDKLIVF
ncbi:MAG: glutathionyl-hydroquinone reductase [Acetobacteraceae bacterium]|jgi:putative glutathione S-transferase|nr:putative glutathione S-transferase domain protein [Rhodopila sp.]MEA2726604.1 glutathionyl-hydroquinone reductase [Acetobacteraceae bacterium]MEA2771708.1 glutathionyl-hydroquinone reductase [Acetobacteraceae bacterium]